MLEVFHEAFDPSAHIIGIEEPFEVDMGKRIPPLVGWIDAVEQAADGTVSIIDLKQPPNAIQTIPSIPTCSSPAIRWGLKSLASMGTLAFAWTCS